MLGKLILIFEMSTEEKNCVCKCVGCLDVYVRECESKSEGKSEGDSDGDWIVCRGCSYVDCVCVYACNVCNYFDCVCGYKSESDSKSEVCVVCKCDDCVCAVAGCVCGVCA